jgi:UDP-hydrolysing UDP-N-acetyl-D-glucosamine 2-epimerase
LIKKRKICFVLNSRANYGRVKNLLILLNKKKNIDLKIVLGASSLLYKFGDITNQIKRDGLKVSEKFYSIVEGENLLTMTKSAGLTIIELSDIFKNIKPDIVVVLADRFENLPVAICASYMNIPLAHIQGGEVTGSIDEKVRHSITKLSDIHFASTERSKKYIINMGENKKKVFNTGCPSIDIAKDINMKIDNKFFNNIGVGNKIKNNDKYIVILQHPVTTEIKSTKLQIDETIKSIKYICEKEKVKALWFWPNVDAGTDIISRKLRSFRENLKPDYITFVKNLSPEKYLKVLFNSQCFIGNSSSGIREGSYLGIPYVNIGNRQKNREKGKNVIDVGYSNKEIIKAIRTQLQKKRYKRETIYGKGNSSKLISELLVRLPLTYEKVLNYIK